MKRSWRYRATNWVLILCLVAMAFGAALCASFDRWLNPKDEKNTTTVTVSPRQYSYPQNQEERPRGWKFFPL